MVLVAALVFSPAPALAGPPLLRQLAGARALLRPPLVVDSPAARALSRLLAPRREATRRARAAPLPPPEPELLDEAPLDPAELEDLAGGP
jgi:hypothetical protein